MTDFACEDLSGVNFQQIHVPQEIVFERKPVLNC